MDNVRYRYKEIDTEQKAHMFNPNLNCGHFQISNKAIVTESNSYQMTATIGFLGEMGTRRKSTPALRGHLNGIIFCSLFDHLCSAY